MYTFVQKLYARYFLVINKIDTFRTKVQFKRQNC
nr:MAG TPA: hypothetical protein [Caudoviricetes sp.]